MQAAATTTALDLLLRDRPASTCVSTGVSSLDQVLGGLPQGAISEFSGARSSGKTATMHSVLAQATRRAEYCAVIDTSNTFDPGSAAAAGVDLNALIWVRCNNNAETAIKATDLLIQGGGMGVVVLDLSDVEARILNRLPASYWFRFRRAIEATPSILLVVAQQPLAKSCAMRSVEFRQTNPVWSGPDNARLLRALHMEAIPRKPMHKALARLAAKTIG